jgi:predicted glycosyltransferase
VKFLIDILHPKHVHFFRPLIKRWQERGHEMKIVTRDKDITHQLLELFSIPYVCLSKQKTGLGLAQELFKRWYRLTIMLRDFRPDIVLSIGGITTSLPSRLLGIPNIALTDTETAELSNRIAFPFADRVLTPEWFTRDFGRRHYRYRSFHEWSYLHPDEFIPDPELVRGEGIDPDQPYAVVRFVRWDAVHDQGEKGFSAEDAIRLIEQLSSTMKVVLTTETAPPEALRKFAVAIRIDRMHHVMAFSRLVVGESPSMCAEAALMGVPSVLASSWAGECGNMKVLSDRFGLMEVYDRGGDAVAAALAMASTPPPGGHMREQRERLVKSLDYIPEMIEGHIRDLARGKDV